MTKERDELYDHHTAQYILEHEEYEMCLCRVAEMDKRLRDREKIIAEILCNE